MMKLRGITWAGNVAHMGQKFQWRLKEGYLFEEWKVDIILGHRESVVGVCVDWIHVIKHWWQGRVNTAVGSWVP
jgi:hypothetical protein